MFLDIEQVTGSSESTCAPDSFKQLGESVQQRGGGGGGDNNTLLVPVHRKREKSRGYPE